MSRAAQAARLTGDFWSSTPNASLLLHDQQLFAIDLDLGARPLAKQDKVAGLEIEGNQMALLVARAGPGGHDLHEHRPLRPVGEKRARNGFFGRQGWAAKILALSTWECLNVRKSVLDRLLRRAEFGLRFRLFRHVAPRRM
jgi:hypothetical protein